MNKNPEGIYKGRIAIEKKEIHRIQSVLDKIAWIRFASFVLGIVGLFWAFNSNIGLFIAGMFLFILLFLFLIRRSVHVRKAKRFHEALVVVNRQELDRLSLSLSELDEGDAFKDPKHDYAYDLDLFGSGSLFQWLNRSISMFGKEQIFSWMTSAPPANEIKERQEAVKELGAELDWRQKLQARGMVFEETGESIESLNEWLRIPGRLNGKFQYQWLPLVMVSANLSVIALASLSLISWAWLLPLLILSAMLMRTIRHYSHALFVSTGKKAELLKSYASMIEWIEQREHKAPWLKKHAKRLMGERDKASTTIRQLATISERLEMRYNGLFYIILNLVFFWDIFWILRLEKWKNENSGHVLDWFEVIGQFEGISSLAAVHYNYPEWNIPEINAEGFELSATDLGHPLIPEKVRVCNSVNMVDKGKVMLITGSNMSGKSTWMRTVGVNCILAYCGGPVCAKAMKLSVFTLATSMRALDSLQESVSTFYAELTRLKTVIQKVGNNEEVFFLLDEILKGTNSKDRHTGSEALIKQLIRNGGTGMVSTHDLELTKMEEALPGQLSNFSFNSTLLNGSKLNFDYKLIPGPCKSFNASVLMKNMGIEID